MRSNFSYEKREVCTVWTAIWNVQGHTVAVRDVTLWFRVDVPGVLVSSSSSSSSYTERGTETMKIL